MTKQIERVYATVKVNHIDMLEFSKEELESTIKQQLAGNLAGFLIENMEKLPILHEVQPDFNKGLDPGDRHTIMVNLISNEELNRLKKIEYEYATLTYNKEKNHYE